MKKIFNFIRNVFGRFKANDKQAIKDAIRIVDNLKNIVNSGYVPILVAIIPGTIDDAIVARLKIELPKMLKALRIIESENLEFAPFAIKQLPLSVKGDFLDALATQIALVLADGRLTWSEVKSVMKVVYDSEKVKP